MKRIAWSIAYLCIGMVLSWQSAIWVSRLSQRFLWPLINTRWHDCWDIEHCQVSVLGYVFIIAFIVTPSMTWALVGFKQANATSSRSAVVILLTLGTVGFYLAYYAAVWR